MHFPHIGHHCYHVDICLIWTFKNFPFPVHGIFIVHMKLIKNIEESLKSEKSVNFVVENAKVKEVVKTEEVIKKGIEESNETILVQKKMEKILQIIDKKEKLLAFKKIKREHSGIFEKDQMCPLK